jgi:hypothetical protein
MIVFVMVISAKCVNWGWIETEIESMNCILAFVRTALKRSLFE